MTDKEKTIKELKEALDSLDITNKYRLNIIRAIEYLQEEPVSEDLEKASYRFACKCHPLITEYSGTSPNPEVIEAFNAGAKWQKTRDQETMETAIHHAYHNGRLEMKEDMMTKSIEAIISQVPCSNEIILYNPASVDRYYLPQEMNKLGLNKGDKIKLVIIKED